MSYKLTTNESVLQSSMSMGIYEIRKNVTFVIDWRHVVQRNGAPTLNFKRSKTGNILTSTGNEKEFTVYWAYTKCFKPMYMEFFNSL